LPLKKSKAYFSVHRHYVKGIKFLIDSLPKPNKQVFPFKIKRCCICRNH